MYLEEAKKFIGKEAEYMGKSGKIIRVAHPFGEDDPGMVIAELDNGIVVNIEILKCRDEQGKLKHLT